MKQMNRILIAALLMLVLIPVSDAAGQSTPTSQTFKVQKGGNLVVDIDNVGASVDVKVSSKLEVSVTAHGIREGDLEDLEITQNGNDVNVFFDPGNGRDNRGRIRFTISVPSEFNLDIGTSGGDVNIKGAITGTVEAGTAGGDITVGDVKGELGLRTAGGDIEAGDVDGDAGLKTAGGDIEVGDVTGTLSAKTAGGDIEAGEVGEDLSAGTAGGDITCDGVGGEAETQTAGGDIELGVVKGDVTAKTAGGDIEVEGATGKAIAKTAGGDIRLSAIVGFAKAVTAGGDIYVELDPSNASTSSMETKGGDVELFLPANAKVTIEALIRLRDWDHRDADDYDITSDFKAESHDKSDREIRARYVINGGGKVISLETVNGNIRINKQ
jgi:DUF4097 and DUF4098 domain-containing protein YvlB